MQAQFYHLLSTPLEKALPKLAQTAYERDLRCCIITEPDMITIMDKALWSFAQASFVPHGVVDDRASQYPIVIHHEFSDVNKPDMVMVTNGTILDDDTGVSRIFDIFNGHDDGAVSASRQRWQAYKDRGYEVTYIKQRADGGWESGINTNEDAA